jgi:hypothetical protein
MNDRIEGLAFSGRILSAPAGSIAAGLHSRTSYSNAAPEMIGVTRMGQRCGHFAFTRNRERASAIRKAWARALTAFMVRPRSAAISKTEALEMISFRSRSSSSEVQAFVLLGFFV